MTLKSLFHVESRSIRPAAGQETAPLESLDIQVEWDEDRPVRGVGERSWARARGWSTED